MGISWLKKVFSHGESERKAEEQASKNSEFEVLSNRFRMFLTAWNRFQEVETQLEYTLCCDHPFGIYGVRALCTDVALQVFQCIRQLQSLNPKPGPELLKRFGELQKQVSSLVLNQDSCIPGPLVVPLDGASAPANPLLAPKNAGFAGRVPERFRPLMAEGFLVTGAGCDRLLGSLALREEINRRIQAGGGLKPKRLLKLAEGIEELIMDQAMPGELYQAVAGALKDLRARCQGRGPMRLLLRGRLWPPESEWESDGLFLWGQSVALDAPDDEIVKALRRTMALKACPQALVYRRARGLTEKGTGFCVACMAVEEGSRGGYAHTANPLEPEGSRVHVYAADGLPELVEYTAAPFDAFYVEQTAPWRVRARKLREDGRPACTDGTASKAAEAALACAGRRGRPQTLVWAATPAGELRLLDVYDMLLRSKQVARQAKGNLQEISGSPSRQMPAPAAAVPVAGREEVASLAEDGVDLDRLPAPLLTGGIPSSPGIAAGHPVAARSWDDIRNIPPHAVLVAGDDSYLWAAALDRVSAVICEEGHLCSRLAVLCREFGIPAVFGLKDAMAKCAGLEWITVSAGDGCVYEGLQDELAGHASHPVDYMPGSPVYRILEDACKAILPLTLDVESLDFTAANCRTYHDIARYCHVKAIDAMFALGSGKSQAKERVRQLYDQVAKQFWVINLSDGFRPEAQAVKGPLIDIKNVSSVPMQALWHGMNAYVWEGPPPVDSKGFLSVLFEATANPHLAVGAQTDFFTEKNYFLVSSQYVSMHSRFGFHFISVEARVGHRRAENYVSFVLRGGAADVERRILRVNFVGDILWEFGFQPDIRNDQLTARLEGMDLDEGQALLKVAGYLAIHTRQLDMIMQDKDQCARKRAEILEHCRILYTGLK